MANNAAAAGTPSLRKKTSPSLPKPFLKWAGGKARLSGELMVRLPSSFNDYHEPFVGGGALFFALYRSGRTAPRGKPAPGEKGRALLSDFNAELIDTYWAVRDRTDEVIRELSHYPHDKDFFYRLRAEDPVHLDPPARAARMIYLNKTCYNGLYRVNSKGVFNVPFGKYKSPNYPDEENLRAVSAALKNVELARAPFESTLERAAAGDLIYFDPPYVPISDTANFTSYHAAGFGHEDQKRLRDVCLTLTGRGVNILLSNSDTPLVRELYGQPPFIVNKVWVNRAINSDGASRGKLAELVITNYTF